MSDDSQGNILQAIDQVQQQVALAAARVGRDPRQIKLVAVTKTVSAETAGQALQGGLKDLGENRVQELLVKYPRLPGARWHLIGHLQTNKVKSVIDKVSLIHSLDSWHLAREIDRRAGELAVSVQVLVQVNVAGELSKYGLAPGEVADFLQDLSKLPNIQVQGLMTIAPRVDRAEEVRPVFRELKQMAEQYHGIAPGISMNMLSMGMTNDYMVAVEEGATLIRVGTALFGPRR